MINDQMLQQSTILAGVSLAYLEGALKFSKILGDIYIQMCTYLGNIRTSSRLGRLT